MNDTNRIPPAGWHSVTPRLVAHHARELVEFLRDVFDAAGAYEAAAPSILEIGDSRVMMHGPGSLGQYLADRNADPDHRNDGSVIAGPFSGQMACRAASSFLT